MMSRLEYDRTHWPEAEPLATVEIDVGTLWEKHEDQMTVLVADAIIASDPMIGIEVETGEIICFLWEVGGDCITMKEPIEDLLERVTGDYEGGAYGADQVEDINERLAWLSKLEDKITVVKQILREQAKGRKDDKSV